MRFRAVGGSRMGQEMLRFLKKTRQRLKSLINPGDRFYPPPLTPERIDFFGLRLVPFSKDYPGYQDPMDVHPASRWYGTAVGGEFGGFFPLENSVRRQIVHFDENDLVRRDMLILLMRSIIDRNIPGDFAEVGIFRGLTAKLIHYYAPDRHLHLFDTFAGFDERDLALEPAGTNTAEVRLHFQDVTLADAIQYLAPQNNHVHFYKGHFPQSFPPKLKERQFAFVHLDADLHAPTVSGLELFYELLAPGGAIVVHDYNNGWFGPRTAVEAFFRHKPEVPVPMPDRSGSVVVFKLNRLL